MRVTETTVIEGAEYSITQLPGRRALEMFNKLCGIMGPAALEAISKGVSLDADVINLAPIGLALFSQIKPGEISTIADELLYAALVDKKPLKEQVDVLFQGKILTYLKVIAFAIKVNFSDFLAAGAGILTPAQKPTESEATTA